jgi:hypothetical protein
MAKLASTKPLKILRDELNLARALTGVTNAAKCRAKSFFCESSG